MRKIPTKVLSKWMDPSSGECLGKKKGTDTEVCQRLNSEMWGKVGLCKGSRRQLPCRSFPIIRWSQGPEAGQVNLVQLWVQAEANDGIWERYREETVLESCFHQGFLLPLSAFNLHSELMYLPVLFQHLCPSPLCHWYLQTLHPSGQGDGQFF